MTIKTMRPFNINKSSDLVIGQGLGKPQDLLQAKLVDEFMSKTAFR